MYRRLNSEETQHITNEANGKFSETLKKKGQEDSESHDRTRCTYKRNQEKCIY